MVSDTLQVLLHYEFYYVTSSTALQVLLRYELYYVTSSITLQVLLRYEFYYVTSSTTLRVLPWHSRPPLILVLEFFFQEKIPSTSAKCVILSTFYHFL